MVLSWSFWICLHVTTVAAAASSQWNYNPYLYDMTIPQFTPDGRLLQVEYATAAADHSSPIVAVRLGDSSSTKEEEEDLVVLACRRQPGAMMDRLLVVTPPPSPSANKNKKKTTAPTLVLALSGVLADSLAIVRKLNQQLLGDAYSAEYTPWDIARMLGRICQERTIAGGMRVYGSTTWIGGWRKRQKATKDDDDDDDDTGPCHSWVMYQTDPSGGVHPIELDDPSSAVSIVGGGDAGRSLQRLIAKKVLGSKHRKSSPRQSIQAILRAVLGPDGAGEAEVVLVSASRGVIKLTSNQIQRYIDPTTNYQ